MRILGITRSGLLAMALSVAALWTCIALEAAALRAARLDALECGRQMQRLRRQALPSGDPLPPFAAGLPKSS